MTTFLEDIWSQNFINLFASPLKVGEYLGGMILTSAALGTIAFGAVSALAGVVFSYNVFVIGILLLPALGILFIFGIAIGFFMAAVIFRFGPAAEWLGWPIPFVLSIFSGVFFPLSTLPGGLRAISKLIPASYVFESVRAVLTTGTLTAGTSASFAVGALMALAYLALMYKFFIRVYRYNLKTGGIARFNAEV